jgi:hypothetical protein
MSVPTFNRGDKVAYSVQFLRSIGQAPTGQMCHWRGIVVAVRELGQRVLVSVQWDSAPMMRVIDANLAHVGPNTRFCAC